MIQCIKEPEFEKKIEKEEKKFCRNNPALIFALPKRNNGSEREVKRGIKKGV
jgi:hypothetical protein